MTPEEKQLLLKDLCARLPYGVKVSVQSHKGTFIGTLVTVTTKLSDTLGEAWIEETDEALWCDYSLFKPYLRSMSSMTEEEESEYEAINCYEGLFPRNEDALDYVLSNHFDYRGLIPMGLALEAKERMYKTE